ncbi:5'-nucleotidase SurE domain protein [Leptospira interrogans serovar Bataviae str. HAI135]|nr:5'-nucleotidase SurE domain protein [Leptospira interrogans serovar Bataviae str. HAI135]
MNILITNDDGIASSGIKALETILQKEHNTYLIAPLRERSATSMALSIYDSMRVEKSTTIIIS